jgi:hypothetical protein
MGRPSVNRRVILDLEPAADSIRGSAAFDDAPPREFQGWLELSALLDRIRPRSGDTADEPSSDAAYG